MVDITPYRNRGELASPLVQLRSEMDRLFSSFFGPSLMPAGRELMGGEWMPSFEISESDKEIIVSAELPGIDPEDVNISVAGNQVTISGEKKESVENKHEGYYHSERRYGSFHRSLELPMEVDSENISADYENGVLTLHIPRSEQRQPRRIQVNSGGRSRRSEGSAGQQRSTRQQGSASRQSKDTGNGQRA